MYPSNMLKIVLFLIISTVALLSAGLPKATNLQVAQITDSGFTLTWTDNAATEDNYSVCVDSKTGLRDCSGELPANTTSYTVAGVSEYTRQKYVVLVYNTGDETPVYSDPLYVRTTHTWSDGLQICVNDLLSKKSSHTPTKSELESLDSFTCSGNKGDIADMSPILDLINIATLSLNGSQITFIPADIGKLTNLTSINISFSYINQPVPPSIGQLTNLQYLGLGDNLSLPGPLPIEMAALNNLQELSLSNTNLAGPFPEAILGMSSLFRLHLSHANLIGTIPPEIQNLSNLDILVITGNPELSGPIPKELFNIDLQVLHLSDNALTGTIPGSIENAVSLKEFLIEKNHLYGSIPESIPNLPIDDLSLFDNCSLWSNNAVLQQFIRDRSDEDDGYQYILDTNNHECPTPMQVSINSLLLD
ncbi:MAG: hypothetical protein B5M52_03290 [Helicobacteraceae bacterium 4484_230]|nr:MAG: hypothetical protein B5M52_03290 [Helicobacteraceae bacterium 4484_230]